MISVFLILAEPQDRLELTRLRDMYLKKLEEVSDRYFGIFLEYRDKILNTLFDIERTTSDLPKIFQDLVSEYRKMLSAD